MLYFFFEDTCAVLESTVCLPCNCHVEGSTSKTCDSTGQCTCKNNFKGTTCKNRDCEYTNWKGWSACPACGHRGTKTRTRTIRHQERGNGKKCPPVNETETCEYITCTCQPGQFGDRCENRHCKLHEWSAWSACNGCNGCSSSPCTPSKRRSRGVKVTKQGSGRDCTGSRHESSNCGYTCSRRCDTHCPPSITAGCNSNCYYARNG